MASLNPDVLESSFAALAPHGQDLADRFYDRLFRDYPGVKPLFADVEMAEQKQKLLASLQLVVANVRKPEDLTRALEALAFRHLDYGAEKEHYDAVITTLHAVMGEVAGHLWTEPVAQAWRDALTAVKTMMVQAAYSGVGQTVS